MPEMSENGGEQRASDDVVVSEEYAHRMIRVSLAQHARPDGEHGVGTVECGASLPRYGDAVPANRGDRARRDAIVG